jgi:hypothetical protein
MTVPNPTSAFMLSSHAALRIRERLQMAESWLMQGLERDRCYWIRRVGGEGQHYALLYCPLTDSYGVAVVQPESRAVLTVLTREQWDARFSPLGDPPLAAARQAALVPDAIRVFCSFGRGEPPKCLGHMPLTDISPFVYKPGCPAKNRRALKTAAGTKAFGEFLQSSLGAQSDLIRLDRVWLAFVEAAHENVLAEPGPVDVVGKLQNVMREELARHPRASVNSNLSGVLGWRRDIEAWNPPQISAEHFPGVGESRDTAAPPKRNAAAMRALLFENKG